MKCGMPGGGSGGGIMDEGGGGMGGPGMPTETAQENSNT